MFSSFEEDQEALRIIRLVFSVVKDVDIFNQPLRNKWVFTDKKYEYNRYVVWDWEALAR
jgi:hypothetical protein